MTYWNYRMTRRTTPEKVVVFEVHEVYYAENGRVTGWSSEPVSPFGESLNELRDDLGAMARCATVELLDLDELELKMNDG